MVLSLLNEFPAGEFEEAPLCSNDHILLYHTEDHLDTFLRKCRKAEEFKSVQQFDSDTAVMAATRMAVFRAVGSVIASIDSVYNKGIKSTFCCVRPPGHHAERQRSMGFCFVNNAAIGAKYAQSQYGVGNVAVLVIYEFYDIDMQF